MKNRSVRIFTLIWAALMIAVLSSTLTLLLSGRGQQPTEREERLVSQEEYDTIRRYSRLEEVRRTLAREYYRELDEDALLLGAIRGMTASVGDRYTVYYTPEELRRVQENDAGVYQGIGVLLQANVDGEIEVVRVYRATPAEEAGVKVGDRIVAVEGEPVSGADNRTYMNAVNRIRGVDGTQAMLTVVRDGQRMNIPVRRGGVSISYASYRVLDGNIGYISISQFTGDAAAVYREALEAFKAQGIHGLVIDVRNNPGGMLDQVVGIADTLLPAGVIVYVKDRNGVRQDYYSDDDFFDVPLAVLVNGMSASASEILASSVQAMGRGSVVGLDTYGKGIVQTLINYAQDGAGLQLTTSRYYDALDRCPHGVGVKPDIEVALEARYIPAEPDLQSDNQLAAAVAEVRRQIAERG